MINSWGKAMKFLCFVSVVMNMLFIGSVLGTCPCNKFLTGDNIVFDSAQVLFVNRVSPTVFEWAEGCKRDEDIKIRNGRIIGQVNDINMRDDTWTKVLRLVFSDITEGAPGASISIHGFGVGYSQNLKNECEDHYFDVFFDVNLFSAPGNGGDSGICGEPVVKFGHTEPMVDFDIRLLQTDSILSPEVVDVEIVARGLGSEEVINIDIKNLVQKN